MDTYTIVGIITVLAGFYMAWTIGANDVANAMGTSVGSKALTLKQAVLIAAIFEFAGAVLVGSSVTNTIRKGMIDPSLFDQSPETLMFGMLAALLAAAVWLQIATHRGLPVSTTHSIIGAVVGFALIAVGSSGINWGKVLQIVSSWLISPLMGALIAWAMFVFIRNKILDSVHPLRAVKKYTPYLVFILFSILTLSMVYKGLKNLKLDLDIYQAIGVSLVVGLISSLISHIYVKDSETKLNQKFTQELHLVESIFRKLQIITACYMALDRKSTRLNSSHTDISRMPSSA